MKKALIVANLAGFIGTFLQNDIKILKSMGYEVHCAGNASNKNPEENERAFREFGTAFHQIDVDGKSPLSRSNMKALRQLRRLMKTEKFELVHCHTPIAGAIARVVAAPYRVGGGTRCRVIYTSHGFYFHEGSGKKSWILYYSIEKFMSLFSDAIITINEEDYKNAKKMFCKKVYHINGVGFDASKYRDVIVNKNEYRQVLGVPPDALMILAVGELSDRKNHQVVVKAMGKAGIPNAVFAVCGKAIKGQGTFDKLIALAEKENVNIMFLGHRADIPQVCHCADIGVLPSTREGLGMAGLEMLAAGLPLVTSNVHGIKDYMVDGVTGYMVSPYDVDGFSDALIKLSDSDVRERMKSECIRAVEQFDNSVSNQQMLNIYQELLC